MPERPPRAVPGQRQVEQRDVAVADGLAERKGQMLDAQRAARVSVARRWLAAATAFDAAECLDRFAERDRHRIGIGGDIEIDGRKALMVHAPAVVHGVVERDVDHLRLRRAWQRCATCRRDRPSRGSGSRRPPAMRLRFGGRSEDRRRADMQRMIGRESGADLEIGDDARIEPLGERDASLPGVRAARGPRPPGSRPGVPAPSMSRIAIDRFRRGPGGNGRGRAAHVEGGERHRHALFLHRRRRA